MTAARWFSLRFDDAGLVLPAVISATGKRCDGGVFTLVLTPYTGSVVYLVRGKDEVVRRWNGAETLGNPTVACKNPRELTARALKAEPDERLGLNKRWNGAWTGRILCDGKVRMELDRTVAGAKIEIRSLPGMGWSWRVSLGRDHKDGTGTKLRDAVSYVRAAMRELVAAREATRVTGERKGGKGHATLDRPGVRAWTKDRVSRPPRRPADIPF